MARLTMRLFGQLQIQHNGMPLTALHTARLQSLLAYLVLETAYPHSRAQLAALFWPDEAEAVARQNLRQALYQLRQLLDKPNAAAPPYLLLTHEQVQFNPAADYETDVATFLQRLAHGEARAAIDLYVDDLLPELHSVSDRFDEWLVWRREGLHIRAMATLDQLTTRALDQQQFAEAAVYARRQLTFEPWLEPAHRQLMLALAHKGDRHEALAQFEQCVQLLQRELGVTPDQATVTLATQIRAGTFATAPQAALPTHAPQPTTAPPATPPEPTLPQPAKIDWGEAPEITALHGREAEMQLLTRWLVTDQCRLVAVVGMGGMGKTTLAASTVHQVAEHFDVVIWRSLLNAPQPEEMIRSWLRLLDEAQTTQAAQDFDTALAQLFTQLQGRRCLLILDNVESLLQSDDRAGHYRSGYAAYGQLFKRFGETSHRSTLFLTSREAPQEVVRLARERPTVQSLALVGLSVPAGQAILRRQGITVRDGSVELLVARYSGNPLALMLVGETIQELFAGDVAAFLEQPLIFDDIRDVLDQQWTRLSALERTLLLWLAIEREPLTPTQLSANLYPAVPLPTLIEALNSLRRRSLLERQGEEHRARSAVGGQGFLLQNVVTEYLTTYFVGVIGDEIMAGRPHLFNQHALVKAQSKEYVRQSQRRLILQPIAEQLRARAVGAQPAPYLTLLSQQLQTAPGRPPHYGAGNLLNLLVALHIDIAAYDFSGLVIRQADLMDVAMRDIQFRGSHFEGCRFTDKFGAITAMTFSPDGQLLAAGTAVGNIRLWRVADGQPLRIWHAHSNYVFSVLFSPDGATLYSCSDDQLIKCWEVATVTALPSAIPALRYSVSGHQRGVWRLARSPDGRRLASAGGDGVVILWDAITGTERFRCHEHAKGTRAVAIDPTGTYLVAGGEEGLIVLWRIADGRLVAQFHDQHASVMTLAFSPDGMLLAAGHQHGVIRLWQMAELYTTGTAPTPQHLLTKHTGAVTNVDFSPDGALLASSSSDQTVCLWHVDNGELRVTLYGHNDEVERAVFSPDGKLLASGSADRALCLWEVASGHLLQRLHGHVQGVMGLALSADSTVLASAHQDRQVRLWDVTPPTVQRLLPLHHGEVTCVAWQPRGELLASGSIDHTIQLWDRKQGGLQRTLHGHQGWLRTLLFRHDGTELVSCSNDWTIRHWQVTTGALLQTIKLGYSVWAIALSTDEMTLACGGTQGTVQLLNWPQGEVRLTLHGHTNWVTALAFKPGGTLLASGGGDQQIRLWDTTSGHCLHTLQGHQAWIYALAFAPDGALLASSSADRTVCLWNIKERRLLHTFRGHDNEVRAVIFSHDGQCVISGSADETIRWWDVRSGACLATVHAPRPYEGMQIAGATGLTAAQVVTLEALGAVGDLPSVVD